MKIKKSYILDLTQSGWLDLGSLILFRWSSIEANALSAWFVVLSANIYKNYLFDNHPYDMMLR